MMERIGEFLPFMLEGSVTTVQVFVITLVLSLPRAPGGARF